MYYQIIEIFRPLMVFICKLRTALHSVGADMKDIVRTRHLVTRLDQDDLDEIARAHRERIVT